MGKAVFFKLQQIQSKRFQLENLRFVFFWGEGFFFNHYQKTYANCLVNNCLSDGWLLMRKLITKTVFFPKVFKPSD